MARERSDLPVLDDAAVPGDTLLGAGRLDLLQVAVGGRGGTVRTATPRSCTYEPSRSLTVRYDAVVAWRGGRTTTESVVASAGRRLPPGALVLEDGEHSVAVWSPPADPWLPGLAAALDATRCRDLLADLGAPVDEAHPRLRTYRAGRRAVVEVVAPGVRLYLKVLRPSQAEDLHRRHVLLAPVVPVPRSLGWSPELGIVALQALPGRTLRRSFDVGAPLLAPSALLALLDALPDPGDLQRRTAPGRAQGYASLLAAVAPELRSELDEVLGGLDGLDAELASLPEVPVHGDLHEAQLLVDSGRLTGLLDVDTFGQGRRIEDLATMIGHLATLRLTSTRPAAVRRQALHLLDAFDARVEDPALLRRAVAAAVLGLATGPLRVLEPGWRRSTARRIGLASQWLASAETVAGRREKSHGPLMARSAPVAKVPLVQAERPSRRN